jgi:hypothetical protein
MESRTHKKVAPATNQKAAPMEGRTHKKVAPVPRRPHN